MQYMHRWNFLSTSKYNQGCYSFETFRNPYRNDALEKATAGKHRFKIETHCTKDTNYVQAKQKTAKYHQNSYRHKELCQYVAGMLDVDVRPICIVKDVGFKVLVMNLDSRFDPKSSNGRHFQTNFVFSIKM